MLRRVGMARAEDDGKEGRKCGDEKRQRGKGKATIGSGKGACTTMAETELEIAFSCSAMLGIAPDERDQRDKGRNRGVFAIAGRTKSAGETIFSDFASVMIRRSSGRPRVKMRIGPI